MAPQSPIKRKVVKAGTRVKYRASSRTETNRVVTHGETRKGITLLKRVGYSNIHTLTEDNSAFFYEAGMMIDADGGYHAYHPNKKSGLDFLGNAGKPGNWWALVTDNGRPSGRPVIQTAKDPAPGFYISTTTLEDKKADRRDPRRYVNAEAINFIVLPGRLNLGAKLGDLAAVIRPATGAIAFAIYADVGPAKKIGEASIALAKTLAIPSNPKTGGVGHGIIYIVFTGTTGGWPISQKEIDQQGSELFQNWGGKDKAKACFPDQHWA
jgi:Fungal chitosanase of glycosyl hydrolase group 75